MMKRITGKLPSWESSSDPGRKRINTAVGLDHSQVWTEMIKTQREMIRLQQMQIDQLRRMVEENVLFSKAKQILIAQ